MDTPTGWGKILYAIDYSVCITANSCEAYNQFLQNKGCFIEVITINEVKFFTMFIKKLKQLMLKLKTNL